MSRPRNPDIIRTRLMDVGLSAFARRGYHGTGIKEIVDTAQVPKGSFYNYFKSKEEFGIAIIERHSAEFWQKWHECFESDSADPLKAIHNCIVTMINDHTDCAVNNFGVLAHAAAELCESSDESRLFVTKLVQEWKENLAEYIFKAQQAGSARSDVDAGRLSTLFWDAWHGAMLRVKILNSVEPVRQQAALILDFMQAG